MPCVTQKVAVAGALAGVAGSGVIAIVGAPTVVLSAAGGVAALGAFAGLIAALGALKECYEAEGKLKDAGRLAEKIAALEEQFSVLRLRLGDA
jgi:CDP-diglyceride synthetase